MKYETLKFNPRMNKRKIIISGIKIYLLIIFTTIFICFRGSMDGASNPEYLIKAWMIEDGLPQNSILSIRQTHDSYLWLGTQLGLVRFDGLLFPIYNQWNTPSLKNNRIVCLLEDTDNRLWIGTGGGGLSCLDKNHWTNFQTKDGLSSNHIKSVFQDRAGAIWVGTDRGLDLINNGRINAIIESDKFGNNPVNSIEEDNRQNLWIASGNGILFKKSELPNLKQSFKKILDIPARCLWADRSDGLWIGTEKGLRLIRNEKTPPLFPRQRFWTIYRLPPCLKIKTVSSGSELMEMAYTF
jgi:ligand-binding sensor domain-containing protein